MRDALTIKKNIEDLKYEIRLAQREETSERELESLYKDLEELTVELYAVQSGEQALWRVSPLQV